MAGGPAGLGHQLGLAQERVEHDPPDIVCAVLVEEILDLQGALTLGGVRRVEGRIWPATFEFLNYSGRVADSGPIDIYYGEGRCATTQDACTGGLHPWEHGTSLMRNALVVQRPASLLVEVRDVEVPEDRDGH